MRPCSVRTRVLSGAAVALAVLVSSALASAELPPEIQVDRLLVQAEREMESGEPRSAVRTFERILGICEEHGLPVLAEFWFQQAGVLNSVGQHEQAIQASTRYLEETGRKGQHYQEALRLLDAAEFALAERRRQREQDRIAREIEALRREAEERRLREIAARRLKAYADLRARLQVERATVDGAFADELASGGHGPEMVVVRAGSYEMGCKNRRDSFTAKHRRNGCDERHVSNLAIGIETAEPLHRVDVASFALARHDTTVAEWFVCVASGGCDRTPVESRHIQRIDMHGTRAIELTWDEAQEYAAWLSRETGEIYRLPSEAEWEYAARAGTKTRFYWGVDPGPPGANCCDGSGIVASFPPNPLGLYDIAGPTAYRGEWVQDCWNRNYEGAPRNGGAWMDGDCSVRVQRGNTYDVPRPLVVRSSGWYDLLEHDHERAVNGYYGNIRVARSIR